MIRNIINIDEEKCNGCGLCVDACHEGALKMVDGKAKLVSESYCDGLGDCLPECPTGAITIEKREAEAYDEELVKENMLKNKEKASEEPLACGCPGTHAKKINRKNDNSFKSQMTSQAPLQSQLNQWPCQIKLVPVKAPYLANAHLLIAADCTAYAYADLHNKFMKNKITLIGCPKLDSGDYSEKLTEILKNNDIKSITIVRMEVPCCGGIVNAVKQTLINSQKMIPWSIYTVTTDGQIIE